MVNLFLFSNTGYCITQVVTIVVVGDRTVEVEPFSQYDLAFFSVSFMVITLDVIGIWVVVEPIFSTPSVLQKQDLSFLHDTPRTTARLNRAKLNIFDFIMVGF